MYRGDGSYKNEEIECQESLIELLTKEDEQVKLYNSAARACTIAKKNSMKRFEYMDELKKIKENLDKTRNDIRNYCELNYGLKSNFSSLLYDEDNYS